MKIVLSRKGFDSSFGGCASPILEDGSLVSLPIPVCFSPLTYGNIRVGSESMAGFVGDLTNGKITATGSAHLDPDLDPSAIRREPGWRPLFGQAGAAQRHLDRHDVGPGDLFLFFGWFKRTERCSGSYRFIPEAPDLHLLFGWLRVGEIWRAPDRRKVPAWAREHPHIAAEFGPLNTVYVADSLVNGRPDAGLFRKYDDALVLTEPQKPRGSWRLPRWFYPRDGAPQLSYHRDTFRWHCDKSYAYLRSVARGQEFVLDTADYPEASNWAQRIIGQCRGEPASCPAG